MQYAVHDTGKINCITFNMDFTSASNGPNIVLQNNIRFFYLVLMSNDKHNM